MGAAQIAPHQRRAQRLPGQHGRDVAAGKAVASAHRVQRVDGGRGHVHQAPAAIVAAFGAQRAARAQRHHQPPQRRPSDGQRLLPLPHGTRDVGHGQCQQCRRIQQACGLQLVHDQRVRGRPQRGRRRLPGRGVQHRGHALPVGDLERHLHGGQRGFELAVDQRRRFDGAARRLGMRRRQQPVGAGVHRDGVVPISADQPCAPARGAGQAMHVRGIHALGGQQRQQLVGRGVLAAADQRLHPRAQPLQAHRHVQPLATGLLVKAVRLQRLARRRQACYLPAAGLHEIAQHEGARRWGGRCSHRSEVHSRGKTGMQRSHSGSIILSIPASVEGAL